MSHATQSQMPLPTIMAIMPTAAQSAAPMMNRYLTGLVILSHAYHLDFC